VVYPESVRVKPVVVVEEMLPLKSCGAKPGIVRVSVVGEVGVTLNPFCNENDGVITIFPDVVPLCRGTAVAFPLNNACVVFAGIVKLTESAPLANRIEESPAKTFELKASVKVP
jgi:hypothetical protein